jgi:predicted DNA-binding transcriptional regulator YafY
MASAEQMVRVVALWQALSSSPRGIVLKRFAEQRGWPVRYLYRDLRTLESAGFPVEGERGRYRLPPRWAPPSQVEVDAEERVALFIARQLAGSLRGTSLGRALDRLWAKLGSSGPQGALVADFESALVVRSDLAIDYSIHRTHIAIIERAIASREALATRYRSPHAGEITDRVIEPGELYFDPGLETMYCIAWCRLRRAVRVFAVHRFLEVRGTGEAAPVRTDTRSPAAMRKAFRVWRSETAQQVRLEFSPRIAGEIRERRWHASQIVSATPGGGLILTMEIAEPRELERWLLGFGPDVSVLEPASLAERVRQIHAAASKPVSRERSIAAPSTGRRPARRSRA